MTASIQSHRPRSAFLPVMLILVVIAGCFLVMFPPLGECESCLGAESWSREEIGRYEEKLRKFRLGENKYFESDWLFCVWCSSSGRTTLFKRMFKDPPAEAFIHPEDRKFLRNQEKAALEARARVLEWYKTILTPEQFRTWYPPD